MTEIHTQYEFDIERKTAKLEFWLDDILQTTYELQDSTFTTGPRPSPVEVPAASFRDTLGKVNIWIDFINNRFGMPQAQKTPYEFMVEKEANKLKTKLTIGGAVIAEDVWDQGTDIITFGARDAIDITWEDFKNLNEYWHRLLDEIYNFEKYVPLSQRLVKIGD